MTVLVKAGGAPASPSGDWRGCPPDRPREVAVAGLAMLEGEAQSVGCGARLGEALGRARLVEIDEALVVAEIHRQELGMAVDAEALDHQLLEMPGEVVREIEAA